MADHNLLLRRANLHLTALRRTALESRLQSWYLDMVEEMAWDILFLPNLDQVAYEGAQELLRLVERYR